MSRSPDCAVLGSLRLSLTLADFQSRTKAGKGRLGTRTHFMTHAHRDLCQGQTVTSRLCLLASVAL